MHHSSPSAITYPTPPSPTTLLTAPRPTPALLHPALLPAHDLLHPALPPTSLLHDLPLPYSTQPYTHLTDLAPALPYSQPHDLHTTYPTTQLSIPDPTTLPMCTLHPYPLLRSHLIHILSRTPHTRTTLPTALSISPTDVPCHLYIL